MAAAVPFVLDSPSDVAAGSRATIAREPGQGRKAAALSETNRVPRVAWSPREGASSFAFGLS